MKATERLISVVIPTYNQAQYLTEAIQSVLDQHINSYEIIVVDDGSIDETAEVVNGFGNRVSYIYQENQGLAGARNTGICAAQGDYVALLDSDDMWLPPYLETMARLLNQNPEAAIYYCRAQCMDSHGNGLPQVLGGPGNTVGPTYKELLRYNYLIPSTIILRRSVVVAAGLFDLDFRRLQDRELWVRLLQAGHQFVGSPEILVRYRVHDSNLTKDTTSGQQAVLALAIKHFGQDDGQYRTWSVEKRLMYGGVYRYYALTSLQHHKDWQLGPQHLRSAFLADPSLVNDLNLFYDLALGAQPFGFRGVLSLDRSLKDNARNLNNMLNEVFSSAEPSLICMKQEAYGTAYYALGLVAYNTKQLSLSRQYLLKALRYRPNLWRDTLVVGNLIKSFVGHKGVDWIRKARRATISLRSEL